VKKQNERFNRINGRVNKQVERLNNLNERVKKQNEGFNRINGRINKQVERLNNLNERVKKQNERFNRINGRVNKQVEHLNNLNERVKKQNEGFNRINGRTNKQVERLNNLNVRVNKQVERLNNLNVRVKKQNERWIKLSESNQDLNERLKKLNEHIQNQNERFEDQNIIRSKFNIYEILSKPSIINLSKSLRNFSQNNSNFLRIFLGKLAWKIKYRKLSNNHSGTQLYTRYSKKRRDHIKMWGPLPVSYREKRRLKSLKDMYKGKRIFVIGNGPSLNKTPLEKLENEYTFAVNRFYLMFDKIKWKPSFYTTHDWRFIPDNVDEINALKDMTFFFPENFRYLLRRGSDVYWYWSKNVRHSEEDFSLDITDGIVLGGTVIFIALQIARFLGFDPIYLIGVDADYKIPKTVMQEGKILDDGNKLFLESTQDDDANHFDPRYFGKGRKWHHPSVPNMIKGFEICNRAITSEGGRILNATVGGKLEIFERVNFSNLF
jgi:uncharacterized coiled-coil protein SlyX